MIKKRKRKDSSCAYEYYLFARNKDNGILYNGWYTLKEMAELPECELQDDVVRSRIASMTREKTQFKSLFDCISFPLAERGLSIKTQIKPPTIDYYVFLDCMKLWPIGSLWKNAK